MKRSFSIAILLVLVTGLPAQAADMREAYQKAAVAREQARQESTAITEKIFSERETLLAEMDKLRKQTRQLEHEVDGLKTSIKSLEREKQALEPERKRIETDLHELTGMIRVVARDCQAVLSESHFTALHPDRLDFIDPILSMKHFPGIDDLNALSALLWQEIELADEVGLNQGAYINAAGKRIDAQILTLGGFMAISHNGKETGILNYAPGSREFVSLSSPLPGRIARNLEKYLTGKTASVWIDISNGAALRQLINKPTFKKQLDKGGPIVWPIIILALTALIMGLERAFSLHKVHTDTDTLMDEINTCAADGNWEGCSRIIDDTPGGPVTRILADGIANRSESRETMESILQESILRELPALEKFLPTINILGAIAPLLGLLGTVSGMINTFHVITLYGTGDPRIMSGGISEALITTELGLAVAIPIMLIHTLLSRRVDHIVADMEEKAVALCNTITRSRGN